MDSHLLPEEGSGDQARVLHHVPPLHPALAGMQVVGVPWRLLAVMTLAIFGQLVRPALALLAGFRLGAPIGDGPCLHTSHGMSSF